MTFEARDSAAKIVPARFRKTFPERQNIHHDTGVRHCAAQTKWDTLSVYGSELMRTHHTRELSRRAMTSAFIRFSKNLQSSMDSALEYYEKGHRPLVKCPSAPSLVREFHHDERRACGIEAPRILRVGVPPAPKPNVRRLSTNVLPRQTMSVDNPAVREVYTSTYPAFIGERGDEDLELGASATGVHQSTSEASLALDLHLPQCAVTLSIRDSSRSPSGRTDATDDAPSINTPIIEAVENIEPVAGPSGINQQQLPTVSSIKVDKQTSTADYLHLGMLGWSRDENWENKDAAISERATTGGGSFRESRKPRSSKKVKRSETIDTASSAHRRSQGRHVGRTSSICSSRSAVENRRLVSSRSETSRRHQLLRQPKVESGGSQEQIVELKQHGPHNV